MTVTLNLLAVPNGFASDGSLAVSIVVAPHLSNGRRLGEFPAVLAWTQQLVAAPPRLALSFGGNVVPATLDLAGLRPDLWSVLFDEQTPVTPFAFEDASNRVVVSYRTRDALEAVKQSYQSIIAASPRALPAALAASERLTPLVLPQGKELAAELANRRLDRWRRQHDPAGNVAVSSLPDTARDFMLFYRMPQPSERADDPVPRSPEALHALLDFHAVVTALSAHPSLMRALGLVLDATVDAASIAAAGAFGMPLASLAVANFDLEGGFDDVVAVTPNVLYRHQPAGAGLPALFTTADGETAAIAEGFLGLDERQFHLLDLDIDGALAKLTNLATMLPRAAASPTSDGALPALRSAGLSLAVHDRGAEVVRALQRAAQVNQALTTRSPAPLTASDLVRGYRLDVWSSSTQRWRSLHRRQATYTLGADGDTRFETEEEGFVQFAAASPARDSTRPAPAVGPPLESDLYVHEALARWTGWSLSAPRPEKAIHRSDPHDPLKDDETTDALVTAFHLRQRFTPVKGSLPLLRFGRRYRVRVRVVDVAGNGPAWNEFETRLVATPGHPVVLPPTPEAQSYYRYEPVPHPLLVFRSIDKDQRPALDRLVIRSFNASPGLDAVATPETSERHVAPPRAVVDLVERHGMLDDEAGRPKGDAATFALIVARSDAVFPSESLGTPPEELPIARAARLLVDYLPDPLARCAALRFLPGVARGRVTFAGAAGLVDQASSEAEAGPVVQVHFGDRWPEREGFRLLVTDGELAPAWDPATRVLTAFLPKASDTEVRLSSGVSAADLELLGLWAWEREYLERLGAEIVATPTPDLAARLQRHAELSALLLRLALEGGQWALTPSIPVHLIHAVQQPLGVPVFTAGAAARALTPVRGSSLRAGRRSTDARAPLLALRALGSPAATLVGGLDVHLRSAGRVDLLASWNDIVDDASEPSGFTLNPNEASLEPIQVDRIEGAIPAQGAGARQVAVVLGETQLGFLPERFEGNAFRPAAAPIQHFGDPRHRRVSYRALATSRFEADFPADQGLVFTRSSPSVEVSVPNSAKPPVPELVQVLPTFGWEREQSGSLTSSIRRGRGVRVYLARPWFKSGEGELLGVVLWPEDVPAPSAKVRRDDLAGLVTEWGLDPLRRSGQLAAMPGLADFPASISSMQGVNVPEIGLGVDIAGHSVHPDGPFWYADITLAADDAYMPFVRLALVRFQPESLAGAEISAVVSAGFTQLTPDRAAVLIADPALPRVFRLVISGLAPLPSPKAPWSNTIEVAVEERREDVLTDLGWKPASAGIAKVTAVTTDTSAPAVLFSGVVEFAVPPARGRYRLVVREYETWEIDAEPARAVDPQGGVGAVERLVRGGEAAERAVVAPADAAFVFTGRAIERLAAAVVGPPTARRIVYAEFIGVEPSTQAADQSLGVADSATGVGEPGADLFDFDAEDDVPPFPPRAGQPASPFQPRWDELPTTPAGAKPSVVSGEVKLAQAMLNRALSPAVPLVLDGLFGPLAELALSALRSAAGLPEEGGLDGPAWLALATAAPFPTLEPGLGVPPMTGPPVALVQRLLNTISDSNFLVEDGRYTAETAARVRDFQSVSELPATGVVDFATWLALADLFEHFSASGAEMVTLGFERTGGIAGGPAFSLLVREPLQGSAAPASDRTDESLSGRTGLWAELQDSQQRAVFRVRLGQLLSLPVEVPPGPDAGERIARPGPIAEERVLSFVVPVLAAARRLVVFGTLDPGDSGPSVPLAAFEPW